MAERLLFDTDVLIDALRGQPDAVDYLDALTAPPLVSAVTVAELYAGVREGPERAALVGLISRSEVVPADAKIAVRGGLFRRDFRKSHATGLADALIAATADVLGATLVTLNQKHFPMLTRVIVPYQKP